MTAWSWLAAAVVIEVFAITVLTAPPARFRRSAQVAALVSWALTVPLLQQAVTGELPLAVVYGVWSAAGAAGVAVTAALVLHRPLDRLTVAGVATTAAGAALVLASRSTEA